MATDNDNPGGPLTRQDVVEAIHQVMVEQDDDLLIHQGDHIAENWTPEHTTQWIDSIDRTDGRSHKEKLAQMVLLGIVVLGSFLLIGYLVNAGHGDIVVQVAPHLVTLIAGFAGGYGYARSRRPSSD